MTEDDWNHIPDGVKREITDLRAGREAAIQDTRRMVGEVRGVQSELSQALDERDAARDELAQTKEKLAALVELLAAVEADIRVGDNNMGSITVAAARAARRSLPPATAKDGGK